MEKADIRKKIYLALVALLISVQKGTAFSTSPSALTSCASKTANIAYTFSIDATETILGTRTWFFGTSNIAESDGATLTPAPSYSSRLTAYGTSGISLSNITVADAGTYFYVIVLLPTASPFTATTTLSVQVAPLAPPPGCQVSATQSSNILTCAVNTDSGNCGTPSLNAIWVYSTNTSNQIECNDRETYECCATSAALTCYSGSSNDFCKQFTCTSTKCQLELGLALGLGLGIQYVITNIDVGIIIYTSCKYAYILGLVLGLGLGVIFQVGWIIIVSLISKGNECKLELGLGLGLGSGMPYVISFIVSVIFMFFLCKGIPNRVELGKGILTGFLLASVVGIILVYFKYDKLKPEQTSIPKRVEIGKGILTGLLFASVIGIVVVVYLMCHKRKRKLTSTKHEDNPPKQDGTKHEHNPPKSDGKKHEQVPLQPADKKSKTKNPGSSAVSREHVSIQMEKKGVKDDDEESPPAVHTGTQNKVEPDSNQTNDRQQPPRPQPPPPQNGETPRPKKLPPLTAKQETVQEVDASEESKKKRKKKKKKDQMNEKTLEEENGETDLWVN